MRSGGEHKPFHPAATKAGRPPPDVSGAFAKALALHQAGSVADAQALYKVILRIVPDHFDALHLLGVSECQLGHVDAAERFLRRALAINPRSAAAYSNLGNVLFQSKRLEEALASFEAATALKPDYADAFFNRGNTFGGLRRFDEAVASYDTAISLKPGYAEAFSNRSNALQELQRPAQAMDSCDKAIALRPDFAEAWNNRANALRALRRLDEALASYERAIALKPDFAEAYRNRGVNLLELKRPDAALQDFDKAISLDPNNAAAHCHRGNALMVLERLSEALESHDRAIELDAQNVESLVGRADILRRLQRPDDALASYDGALAIQSDLAQAWIGRAIILSSTRLGESIDAWKRALAIEPNSPNLLVELAGCYANQGNMKEAIAYCDRALAIDPALDGAMATKIFAVDLTADADFEQHQDIRRHWWRQVAAKITARPLRHGISRDPGRRIVLGYVSSDFKTHSAALAFWPVLQRHDKSRFKIICYSCSPHEDRSTAGFRQMADTWRSASQMSDELMADQIAADNVDILIDLSGHTAGNRLRVFAAKPAPIQVSAWGSGHGTGLPAIDYLFSDPVTIPAAARHLFAERIYDLPCAISMEPVSAEWLNCEPPVFAKGHITFGVFNRINKISDDALDVWASILQSDPRWRLLIKNQAIDDDTVRTALRERFSCRGIAPERIDLVGSTSREEHLQAFRHVDIALDPFPQNGGISTWEALSMGVPVVAKLGNSVPSRISGAILSAIDMKEWVATGSDEYRDIALRYASRPDELRKIRQGLPARIARSSAGNPDSYARAVDTAYRTMWERYCEGEGEPLGSLPIERHPGSEATGCNR
jgi:predicted O-linked N-acetylglucosamine transferase (SPINDLY family)